MRFASYLGALLVGISLTASAAHSADAKDKAKDKEEAKVPSVYPLAVLGFEEKGAGAKELGPKVSDLLFAKLAVRPELLLVDRADLKKVFEEQALNASGVVKADEAVKVGQLTGARLLVTGSVIHIDKKIYIVAKVISSETSRVSGASVEGNTTDELGPLIGKLAESIGAAVEKNADSLVPKPLPLADRAAAINKKMGKAVRPSVMVKITERHIGAPAIDPAAQTEISLLCKEVGFDLIDGENGNPNKVAVLITGEGFSEVAGRIGGLFSVRARIEVKAVDPKTNKVLAIDRQTSLVVGLTENVAGKEALQEAAAILAERILPKLVPPSARK
ncbi:MAG: CsgG/HfaB family protein [Planctomycetes bacterium]|nr:CsgG/HfaB family protein [Planctomycetota bacterium]